MGWLCGSQMATPRVRRLSSVRSPLFATRASSEEQSVRWPWLARRVAPDLFADDTWHYLATRSVQLAQEHGALAVLPLALNNLATCAA